MATSVQVRIEPFNGSNFQNWKFRVEGQLLENDCKVCLEPSFQKQLEKGEEKAIKKDNRAKNILIQCLRPLTIVREKRTAFDMWRALSETYEKKGMCGKILLKKKLLGTRMTPNETIDNYILRFESVLSELRTVDSEMSEDDTICSFLMGG
uniref:Retrovirus-related Pol polyprotein from transposon TNT 1-94 n=1 Tax=Cacopsylla melanoneura TaxID=428564 RepID=A0A8D9E7F0_9HEMI